jgi:tRNA-splicing ligase RtcB
MERVPRAVLQQVEKHLFEIPQSFRADMRVPARVFASDELLTEIEHDRSLTQLVNTATLPGIVPYALAMPDMHEGYGFPIGGVVATRLPDGVVSPGGVGYDINCGVRVLVSVWDERAVRPHLEKLAHQMSRDIPSGVGRGGTLKLTNKEMDDVLEGGVGALTKWGYVEADDPSAIESGGCIPGADAGAVSDRAKARGCDQLGTMGSGNHFVEIQYVEEVFDETLAALWGLKRGTVLVMIHTGSRGLGHQTCTDYVRLMLQTLPDRNFTLPDRELACAPMTASEGKRYLAAMAGAANFAFANRQMIAFRTRQAWSRMLGEDFGGLATLYDVAHNIAKIERHTVSGKEVEVCVHRKGAIRAFPKGHPELAGRAKETGQPVLIPGTMGTSSFLMVGTDDALRLSFGTVCHGAGRRMSRKAAKTKISLNELRARLHAKGIIVKCPSAAGLTEEAPEAYKDVEEVVRVVHESGLAKKVARVSPMAVIKGG